MPVSRRRRSARATLPATVLATLSAALLCAGPAGADEPPSGDQGLQLTMSGAGNTWTRGSGSAARTSTADIRTRTPPVTR